MSCAEPAHPLRLAPPGGVRGEFSVPGSKSISNRALLLGLLAPGRSTIRGLLRADDTEAMATAIEQLGAVVELAGSTAVIEGTGGTITSGPVNIDARQSGTTARFVAPVVCLGRGSYRLDGDHQLRRRPMGPLLTALESLGADVTSTDEPGHLPVLIEAGWRSGTVTVDASHSSQFLSGLLLAAPCAPRPITVVMDGSAVNEPFIDMTVSMAQAHGAHITRPDRATYLVEPTGYDSFELDVEPDATAASYFFGAAAATGGQVTVTGLQRRSTLQGDLVFLDLLSEMGATVTDTTTGIQVTGNQPLRAVDVDLRHMADVVPTLAIVAALAEGTTTIRGVGYIRHHESDRIAVLAGELRRCGIHVVERADGLEVTGGHPHAAVVDSHGDHRIAMAFAVLGLVTAGLEISGASCVAKTFPDFWANWAQLTRP